MSFEVLSGLFLCSPFPVSTFSGFKFPSILLLCLILIKYFLLLNWISGRKEINDFKSAKMAGKGRVKGKPKNVHFQVSFSVTYAQQCGLISLLWSVQEHRKKFLD